MAFEGTLTTEAECDAMAGANVNAGGWVEANINAWVKQAESYLCALCRYNFVDNYASLNEDVKKLLNEYCARYAAVGGISYDMSGFTSRIEAEDMINIHVFRMRQIEELLKDQKSITYMMGA